MHCPTGLLVVALSAVAVAHPSRIAKRDATGWLDNIVSAASGWSYGSHQGNSWGNAWQSCDLSKAKMPMDSGSTEQLPASEGTLAHVLVGRGTQNYTCDASNPSAAPTAIGATADLYDASCVASNFQVFLNFLPMLAYNQDFKSASSRDPLLGMELVGHHYFLDPKSPVFNLKTPNGDQGYAQVAKKMAIDAPGNAPAGAHGACSWLYLTKNEEVKTGSDKTFKDVYRVNTAGGNAPKTCEGQPASFEVQYAAEYWFYQ